MRIEDLFMQKLAEAEQVSKTASAEILPEVEFYQNHIEEIDVPAPVFLTNVIAASAEDEIKILREKKQAKEPEDMIEKAHPKPVYVADAMGDGGLVENQNEQHAKIQQMINKMPTGNLVNNYAAVINELVKMANELQDSRPDGAELVDQTIAELCWRSERLEKEAGLFIPVMVGAVLLGLGGTGFSLFKGIQENLQTDAQDLLVEVQSAEGNSELAGIAPQLSRMRQLSQEILILSSQMMQLSSQVAASNGTDKAGASKLGAVQARIETAVAEIKKQLLASSKIAGGASELVEIGGRIEDIEADLKSIGSVAGAAQAKIQTPGIQLSEEDEAIVGGAGSVPAAAAPAGPVAQSSQSRIIEVQNYLNEIGFAAPKTGVSDAETKRALVKFEKYLNESDLSGENQRVGLGVGNLPGNRLARLLDTSLTADQLLALVGVYENPSAYVQI